MTHPLVHPGKRSSFATGVGEERGEGGGERKERAVTTWPPGLMVGGKGATVNLFHSRARLFALRDIEETGENDGRTQSREIASKWRLLLRNLDRSRSIGWLVSPMGWTSVV